jgi:arylsulfatase A-like enzyme
VGSKNALFILTADHGVTPIPELLNKEGFTNANRILSTRLITQMNTLIKQKFGIKKIIKSFKTNQFFLNKKALSFVNHKTQQDIISSLKDYLSSQQGITACWTPNELASLVCNSTDFEQYFKNQLYPSRSGDLVCMPELNCMLIKYPTGTAHRTPYDPDTHVPLFFYQKGTYENKIITTRVYMTQLAPTLAKILGIPCPNGSSSQLLPEI